VPNKKSFMKKYTFKSVTLFIILISLFSSCTKEENKLNDEKDKYLVSTKIKYVFSESILESSLKFPNIESVIKNGIFTYKLSYTTRYNNKDIIASGTITLPDTPGNYPLVLVERGTILENSKCPSESALPSYEVLAGMGFIVFVPDMIGYGDSNDILHPYFDYQYSATASIDMFFAVKEYLKQNENINANNDFFISGYSQGGYSAMATYKYIIENDIDIDIKIKAVGAGAGGYNVMSIVENVLKEDTYPATILLAMPMVTYNQLYVHKPISDIFNSPYSAMVQNVIDGKKEWSSIANSLPIKIKDIFNIDLINDLKSGKETFLTQSIIDNSVHNWSPKLPVKLYHYPLDEIIPIATTHATLKTMQENGATNIEFVEIPSSLVGTGSSAHGSAGIGALFLAFTDFGKY